MAEELQVVSGTKAEQYDAILSQIEAVISGESDLIANLANVSAMLKEQFKWWWIGFYLVKENELVLGPFQGTLACTRIAYGKGVCGKAWQTETSIIVDDVDVFPGHIACSSLSKSEIVVPIIREGKVVAVLDADSEYLSHYNETDRVYLEQIVAAIPWS